MAGEWIRTGTLEALNGYLESGENYTGEVVYHQRAAQYGDPDYGNTYVEVSISAQHFWYYKNGTVVLESDFVSGDPTKGHDTPKGIYRLAYKARDQVLEGQGYASPVKYWMPFVDGCGFHDADWRDRFGGSIYKGDGSHGCLNLPPQRGEAAVRYDRGRDGDTDLLRLKLDHLKSRGGLSHLLCGQSSFIWKGAKLLWRHLTKFYPVFRRWIKHLIIYVWGTIVVWQVSQLSDFTYFVDPFVKQAIADKRNLIYIRFASP